MDIIEGDAFYERMPDGVRFVNVDTGEIHECFERCDRGVDCGDRLVCPLTKMTLGMSDTTARPPAKKRLRDRESETETRLDRERESRRRVGFNVVNDVFGDKVTQQKKAEYVDRALRVYDWLDEKIPFDAMLYATLLCAAEGIDTPHMKFDMDTDVSTHVKPLRCVGKFGIKQNAVTKAYTAILRKGA